MRESLQGISQKLIFRETFNSEFDTRKNGGVPSNVIYENGVAKFNGANSIINYGQINKLVISPTTFRIKFRLTATASTNQYFASVYRSADNQRSWCLSVDHTSQALILRTSNNGSSTYSASIILSFTELNKWYDIVLIKSGKIAIAYVNGKLTLASGNFDNFSGTANFTLGALDGGSSPCSCDIDLVETYQGELTAEEVKLLYNNKTYKTPISNNLLLDFDSSSGSLKSNRLLTPHNVDIVKTGNYYGAYFNGVDSYIETDYFIGVNNSTFTTWFCADDYGDKTGTEFLGGSLFRDENGFYFVVRSNKRTYRVSNSNAYLIGEDNVVMLKKWTFLTLLRRANGSCAVYRGDLKNAPTLLSLTNKDIGTVSGTAKNLFIGAKHTKTAEMFHGFIKSVHQYEGLLTLDQITQLWSSTKHKVQ